jgi:hypothetical protein
MTFRIASLSLAFIVFVLVASVPRAQTGAPDPAFFQAEVFPFQAAKYGCHSPSGVINRAFTSPTRTRRHLRSARSACLCSVSSIAPTRHVRSC